MKVKELKNKIVIAELDPNCDYIILVNPANVIESSFFSNERLNNLVGRKNIPVVLVRDLDKAIKFVEVKKIKK